MKMMCSSRYAVSIIAGAALLAGCPGWQPPIAAPHVAPQDSVVTLPPNLLYVLGGPQSTRHPSILVFNALDNSKNPEPIYSIGPRQGGGYGLLAVDQANNLFVMNNFVGGAKLLIFPAGGTKPEVNCKLDSVPRDTFIAGNTFYFTTQNYTIEEYSLPFNSGNNCPTPTEVLTDQRAKLRGELGLFGIAADPQGDVFDVWQTPGSQKIDKFPAGSSTAHRFASFRQDCCGYYMATDAHGNVITNSNAIVVFPPAGRPRRLFDGIPNGTYLGIAVADKGRELFAAKDYPTTTVSAYAYDSATGHVGHRLRTFTSNIWEYGQSIAVFSK